MIISEMEYKGERRRIRIERHRRIFSNFYLYIDGEEGFHLIRVCDGCLKSDRLEQKTLDIIEWVMVAAFQ